MEVSVIGSSQAKIGKTELAYRELGFCDLKGAARVFSAKNRVCFAPSPRWRKAGIRFTLRAVHTEAVRSEKVSASARRPKPVSFYLSLLFSPVLLYDAFGCEKENMGLFVDKNNNNNKFE